MTGKYSFHHSHISILLHFDFLIFPGFLQYSNEVRIFPGGIKNTCQYDKAERAIEMSLNAYPDNPAGIQLLRDIKIEKANY